MFFLTVEWFSVMKMCDDIETTKTGLKWKYILRQLLVNSGLWTTSFILGLSLGTPTVLIPQLRSDANFSDTVTSEQATWLTSIIYYSSLPWIVLLAVISEYCGRKVGYIIMGISSFIGFLIFYFSTTVNQIIISEIFQGVAAASNVTISVIIATEYTSSVYRGIIFTITSPSFFWGILVANTIGTFCHWKNIPLLGLTCAVYCLITVYFWPESPLWLAKKGRYVKCMQAHRWLKSSCINSENELTRLINDNQQPRRKVSLKLQANDVLKLLFKKDFYKPLLLSFLLLAVYMFSGKQICSVYAIEILSKLSSDTSTIYLSMLILDVVTIISMYISCGLAKILRHRTLLLPFAIISELLLFSLAAYLYAIKLSIVSENIYISLSLFVAFSMAVSCGPMTLTITISGELIPLQSRSVALCLTALAFKSSYGTIIKISPYMFYKFGMHGTFFTYGVTSSICLLLVYFYMPETKDKTLQEIADIMKGIKTGDEAKELMPIKSDKMSNNLNQFQNIEDKN